MMLHCIKVFSSESMQSLCMIKKVFKTLEDLPFYFQPGLRISHHADDTLNSFCQWQATVSKRKQHDHAVLLTGVDICSFRNAPCDTLGKL